MSQPGVGALLHYLVGGSHNATSEYVGKEITAAKFEDDVLYLTFADGKCVKFYDNGQSCCESRYMRTDDDVNSLVGHTLTAIEVKDASEVEGEYGDVHEAVFIEVTTDVGHVTFACHNKHNGYYGGFGLNLVEQERA